MRYHAFYPHGRSEASPRSLTADTKRRLDQGPSGGRATIPVILVGGATGSGKGLLANEFAAALGRHRVLSTDVRRAVLRAMAPLDGVSLQGSTFEPQRLPTAPALRPDARAYAMLEAQRRALEPGVRAAVDRAVLEDEPHIVEGVHVTPALLDRLRAVHPRSVVVLIPAVSSSQAHRQRFVQRAAMTRSSRPARRYLERFATIRFVHDRLVREANALSVPVLATDVAGAIDRALALSTRRPSPRGARS